MPGSTGAQEEAYLEENLAAAGMALTAGDVARLDQEIPPGITAGARHPDMSLVNR